MLYHWWLSHVTTPSFDWWTTILPLLALSRSVRHYWLPDLKTPPDKSSYLQLCATLNLWILASPDTAILSGTFPHPNIGYAHTMGLRLHKHIGHYFNPIRTLKVCRQRYIQSQPLRTHIQREARTKFLNLLHICGLGATIAFLIGMFLFTFEIPLESRHQSPITTLDFTKIFDTFKSPDRPSRFFDHKLENGQPFPVIQNWELNETDILSSTTLASKLFQLSEGCQLIGSPTERSTFAFTGVSTEGKPLNDSTTRAQLIATAAQNAFQATTLQQSSTVRIVCDSGASLSCIGDAAEFETLTKNDTPTVLKGIAAGLEIKGQGTVRYDVYDENGTLIQLVAKAFWVPHLGDTRLLSPQSLTTTSNDIVTLICHGELPEGISSFAELQVRKSIPGWETNTPDQRLVIPYDSASNLPELRGILPKEHARQLQALTGALQVTDDANMNLTASQKELLKWHYRLGHIGFQWLQWLIRSGRIIVSNKSAVSNCQAPKCAACEYGKAIRRKTETSVTEPRDDKEMELKKDDLIPGQRISVDHYQSAATGRLYSSRGSTQNSHKFHGGAIFVDHASGKVSICHQISLSGPDTIKAKLHFEKDAYDDGVIIQSYHTDNGVFTSQQFMTELMDHKQTIRFSGSGAAHQNGVAERSIRTVVTMARTMMIHAAMRTADGSLNTEMWPMAMDYATWIYNHIPRRDSGASPEELWTRTTSDTPILLSDCHVWGCPVFVLEPKLQKSGIKIPKWHPRSRRGVYMGFSTRHSTLVAMVLNLSSGSITPQFHLVFDDMFHTVASNDTEPPEVWGHLIDTPACRMRTLLDDDSTADLHDDWLTLDERAVRDNWHRQQAVAGNRDVNLRPDTTVLPVIERENQVQLPQPSQYTAPPTIQAPSPTVTTIPNASPRAPPTVHSPAPMPSPIPAVLSPPPMDALTSDDGLRRSRRIPKPAVRFDPGDFRSETTRTWQNNEMGMLCECVDSHPKLSPADKVKIQALLAEFDSAAMEHNYRPSALSGKKANDPDTPTYREAIFGEHGEEYWTAMKNEIEALVKRQTWDIMTRNQVPKGEPIVPGTWAFKCKRRPDGTFRKFKARWCVRGDVETRMNKGNMDTYSPVIQWSSVRLMLIFTILFGLHTQSIDFSNAFAQANMPADTNIYLEMPENFASTDKSDCVLKLKKSLYGSTIAPRLWYEKLKKGLIARNFGVSTVDPCMFIRKDCIVQAYVDDLVIYAPKPDTIDQLLQSFHEDGDEYNWEMTIEGTVQEFLGINLTRRGDEWHLTQEGLIQNVLKATGMLHCNSKPTPGSGDGKPLGSDKTGSPARESWQYSSVVGMLLYLVSNSRPDIAFSVHQCARFTHNPRASHEKALLRICSYLKGTQDQGLIFKPTFDNISVDCYVDADFLGLFGTEDSQDPMSAKSRTGYVITLANCPLLWVSKLQTEIALSTCESEFVALSQAFRSLVPTKRLLEETLKGMHLPVQVHYQAKSTVFEDNAAALGLAITKKFTPRTRHMACKYFWFLEKVEEGLATIVKIESKKNLADIFTKNLGQIAFERVRLLLCGW